MKNTNWLVLAAALALLFSFCKTQKKAMPTLSGGGPKTVWEQIDSLDRAGLPKSALELVEPLIAKSRAENNRAELIKGLIFRAKYQTQLDENGLTTAIQNLRKETDTAPVPEKAILQSMTAQLYQTYLQNQSWRIQNRTDGGAAMSMDDISTWSVADFEREAQSLYLASVGQPEVLKAVQLADYQLIITPGREDSLAGQPLRSTLLDFLGQRAIDFFQNESNFLTEPINRFSLSQNEAFAPFRTFISAHFQSVDTASRKLQAVKVFQKLLTAHETDANAGPRVVVDLQRLLFAKNNSTLADRDEKYLAALSNLQKQHAGQPAEAEIGLAMANYWVEKGQSFDAEKGEKGRFDFKTAHDLAVDIAKRFPGTFAANGCKSLISSILTKEIYPQVEEVNIPGQSILAGLNFKNAEKIHVRVIRWSIEMEALFGKLQTEAEIMDFLKKQPALNTFSQELDSPGDYRNHFTEFKLPALPIGHYAVQVADNQDFAIKTSFQIALNRFHVSNMACITELGENAANIYVADRKTGAPMPGVRAEFWKIDWVYEPTGRDKRTTKLGEATTDADGRATYSGPPSQQAEIILINGRDSLPGNSIYKQENPPPRGFTTVTLFTDRAIYRPGQTVYFKGIMVENGSDGKAKLLPGREVKATFMDANSMKINELQAKTNEFGSFNGSFSVPSSGLTGQMRIDCSVDGSGEQGNIYFSVEDYKRPRFEAKILPVEGNYRLGEAVTAIGEAMNLAGSALDGAAVKWRVNRNARAIYDWGWGRKSWFPPQPDQEVAHGETVTDAAGKFKINFTAQPDPQFENDRENVLFDYQITADVTDAAGETRTTTYSLSMGYASMTVDWSVQEAMSADSLRTVKIFTKNGNGQAVAAKGRLVIQPLEKPFFKTRYWQTPDVWTLSEGDYRRDFAGISYKNEEDPKNWKAADYLIGEDWETIVPASAGNKNGVVDLTERKLGAGVYRFTLTTKDPATGKEIKLEKIVEVSENTMNQPPSPRPFFVALDKNTVEPGETARLLLGATGETNYLVKISRPNDLKPAKWFKMNGLQSIQIAATEADRGTEIGVKILAVRENRVYETQQSIIVPWSNKELKIEYSTFRDKLAPGQKEEWRLKISGPKKEKVAAEMLASMYDASLDQFASSYWQHSFWQIKRTQDYFQVGQFGAASGNNWANNQYFDGGNGRAFPELNWFEFPFYGGYFNGRAGRVMMTMSAPMAAEGMTMEKSMEVSSYALKMDSDASMSGSVTPPPPIEISQKPTPAPFAPRKNLNETVFFFPELRTDADGNILVKFTMNEALTRWKFRALAHTKDLAVGFSEKEVVTQKELMVLPNPPRFLRAGDEVEFVSKISNLSQQNLTGTATILLTDAITGKDVTDKFFENYLKSPLQQNFSVEKSRSSTVAWRLKVPENMTQPILWRVTAQSGAFSDGEENLLPVVTNRMLVTESLVMSVRGGQTKNFELKSLSENTSRTAKTQAFTLEFTPNPAWYAVQSLPYLMEYPHECTEQIMSRLFANTLASSVANSNPKIKAVFDRWKSEGKALTSNLAKNQELKTALLEETPWVLEAQSEAQQKQQIALLFDLNKMADEQARALRQITERQQPDGGWPWFPGGPTDWYITQNVVENLGHLEKLGAMQIGQNQQVKTVLERAVGFCDRRAVEAFARIKKAISDDKKLTETDHLGSLEIQWLYARSFFKQQEMPREAFDFFIAQTEKNWPKKGLQEQAMIAIALQRFGKTDAAKVILRSLRERAQNSEELGMYWNFAPGFYWYDLPIETQSLLIEAFLEVENDTQSADNQRIWLLKNKQTNRWETTKATASAVYALLIGNSKWLDDTKPVAIKIGGKKLDQSDVLPEAGTGYFKKIWPANEVKNDFGKIEVTNPNPGVAWGATYWQYWEDMDKVKSFRETPLKISKSLFKIVRTDSGEKLVAVENLTPGDRLKVRVEIKSDRPMEYLHLKDSRAAGFEPVDVLSQYRYQDGLGYYQSTRDLATHFFISYMPKGTYVLEYQLVVQQRGDFSGGVSTLQCMYAPEFSSHSTGGRVKVN